MVVIVFIAALVMVNVIAIAIVVGLELFQLDGRMQTPTFFFILGPNISGQRIKFTHRREGSVEV